MKKDDKTNKKKQSKKGVTKKKKSATKNKKQNKNLGNRKKMFSIMALIITLGIIVVLILFSDLFNITKVTVINNYKVNSDEIIKNSSLVVGNNMFKTLNSTSKNNIKSNPYVEDVNINKKLNGEVVIDITERTATYILQRESDYAYINNQGYILEISQNPLQLPIIKGFSTVDLVAGNRIEVSDLKKLDTVIQIMEAAKSNGIRDIITAIDISDGNNYVLEIPSELKTVQFGDSSNITVKVLWIVDLINREKGIDGEIIVNVPNIKKVYFREKV